MDREGYPQLNWRIKQQGSDCMMIDSGASEQFVAYIGLFHAIMKVEEVEVELAGGSTVISNHKVEVIIDTGGTNVTLMTIFYIQTLQLNLLSFSTIDYNGTTTVIPDECATSWTETVATNVLRIFPKCQTTVGTTSKLFGQCRSQVQKFIPQLVVKGPPLKTSCAPSTTFWDRRMWHVSRAVVDHMIKDPS